MTTVDHYRAFRRTLREGWRRYHRLGEIMRKKWQPIDGPVQPNGFDDTWVCWQSLRTGKREVFDGYRYHEKWLVRRDDQLGDEWFPIAWMYAELPPEPPRESLQSLAMGALLVGAAVGGAAGFLIAVAVMFQP